MLLLGKTFRTILDLLLRIQYRSKRFILSTRSPSLPDSAAHAPSSGSGSGSPSLGALPSLQEESQVLPSESLPTRPLTPGRPTAAASSTQRPTHSFSDGTQLLTDLQRAPTQRSLHGYCDPASPSNCASLHSPSTSNQASLFYPHFCF